MRERKKKLSSPSRLISGFVFPNEIRAAGYGNCLFLMILLKRKSCDVNKNIFSMTEPFFGAIYRIFIRTHRYLRIALIRGGASQGCWSAGPGLVELGRDEA